MGVIDDYFDQHANELTARFARIRAAHKDSDVKGGANEVAVATLLGQHMADRRVVTNSSVLDTRGQRSDEVDVAICNRYQPFLTDTTGQLLIVEGIDAVVQVKARLTTSELERITSNAISVKQLERDHQTDAVVRVHQDADLPHIVDRALYVAFCFESALTLETATTKLREMADDTDPTLQPDAVFILDRGVIANLRENKGTMRMLPATLSGFCHQAVDDVLLRLFQHLYLMRVAVEYPFHPLTRYWRFGPESG